MNRADQLNVGVRCVIFTVINSGNSKETYAPVVRKSIHELDNAEAVASLLKKHHNCPKLQVERRVVTVFPLDSNHRRTKCRWANRWECNCVQKNKLYEFENAFRYHDIEVWFISNKTYTNPWYDGIGQPDREMEPDYYNEISDDYVDASMNGGM